MLELLVVVGILAALVALALPFYQDYVNQSKLTAAEADLQTFKKALAMYDQLEAIPFKQGDDLRLLIGKYLQDYRINTSQVWPIDPWGADYRFSPMAGTIVSQGPNGAFDTADTSRDRTGDDILVTWKPVFFISGARAVNQNIIEVSFSRKVDETTVAVGDFSVTEDGGAFGPLVDVYRVSDSIYRIETPNMTQGSVYVVTVADAGIDAMDQKQIAVGDKKPDNITAANTITFTY